MIQRTVIHRTRPAARAEVQSSENAIPLTFLVLVLGVVTGIGLAGVVIPAVIHTVLGIVLRTVTGA